MLSSRFWPVLRSGATRRRIRRLVVDLERRSGPPQDPLRRALGDDALAVAFWLADRGEWVDPSGHAVELAAASANRAVTRVEGPHGPLAALIHDRRLRRDQRLLEAVVAAARLALENERLEVDLRARIADVRASRERLVATGDVERRRIERDLHDGAQQRLVSLSLGLQLVGMSLGHSADRRAGQLLEHGVEVATEAIDELRSIAQGVFPPALTQEGLAAALTDLAVAASIAVELTETPQERVLAAAEAAAYFAAVEAIGTAARHDPQAEVRLAARVVGDHLELSVERDGRRGGELHSMDLEDRVDAVGGRVATGPGWLRVEIPHGRQVGVNAPPDGRDDVHGSIVDTDTVTAADAPRRPALMTGLAILTVGANLWWLLALRDDIGSAIVALGLLGAVAFATAGAVALRLRPGNPTGAAMLGIALVLNLGQAAAETLEPWRYTIGFTMQGVSTPLLAILALCFPTGRPRGRWATLLCLTLGGIVPVFIITYALWHPPQAMCLSCPPAGNVLFVGAAPFDIVAFTGRLQQVLAVLLMFVMVTLLARWLRASRPARRVLGPVLLTTVLLAAKRMWDLVALSPELLGMPFSNVRLVIIYPDQVLNALIPLMFLVAVARSEFGRSPLARLLTDVVDERAPARVDHALAAALGDQSVRVGYRAAGTDGFVDLDGHQLQLPGANAATRATFIGHPDDAFAVIVHDAALGEDDRQLEAAAAAVGMALRRERLRAELRVRLQQLSDSRERLIDAVDNQRIRVEDALRRGVEGRLRELSAILDDLRDCIGEAQAVEALDAVAAEVHRARSDLRSFVRGVRPAVITADGFAVAIHELALGAPVPVTMTRIPDAPLPAAVETTIWFVCSESLVNITKHAHATHAEVDVHVDGDIVHVTVADDGVGGAVEGRGSGLRGLRERVEDLGGALSLISTAGSGTTVRAQLPLPAAAVARDRDVVSPSRSPQ